MIKALAFTTMLLTATVVSADGNTNPFPEYNGLLKDPAHIEKMGMLTNYFDEASFYALFEVPPGYDSELAPAPLWKSTYGKVNTAALYYAGKAGYDRH